MTALRAFVLSHRRLAAMLMALVLCLRVLVPQGMMIDDRAGAPIIKLCTQTLGIGPAPTIVLAKAGHGSPLGKMAPDSPCHFTVLGHAMLGGADPVLLLAAIAFVMALGLAPSPAPAPQRRGYIRPPLRGPPARA
jgi:hypothetical protein